MSRRFRTFPDGSPVQDGDIFLLSRLDPSSPTGYSNYTVTGAELALYFGTPTVASFLLLEDGASMFLLEDGSSKIQLQ